MISGIGVSTSTATTSVRGTITSRATLSRNSKTLWMSSLVASDPAPARRAYSASARSISSSGGGGSENRARRPAMARTRGRSGPRRIRSARNGGARARATGSP